MTSRRKGARGPGRPPAGTPALTHEQVLAAAGEVFRYQGYAGTTLRSIADRLAVSTPALYHYYPSKQDLFFAWLDAIRNASIQGVDDGPDDRSPTDRLRDLIVQLTTQRLDGVTRIGRARLNNRQIAAQLPPGQAKRFVALERKQMHTVRDLIDEGVTSGEFEALNRTALAFTILGLPERALEWFRPGGELSAAQVARLMGDLAVRMLRAPS